MTATTTLLVPAEQLRTVALPDALARVVYAQLEVFTQLQQTRYAQLRRDGHLPVDNNDDDVASALATTASTSSLSPSQWCERYRVRLHDTLGDAVVSALWALTSHIVAVLASGATAHANASALIVQWYRAHMMDEAFLQRTMREQAQRVAARQEEQRHTRQRRTSSPSSFATAANTRRDVDAFVTFCVQAAERAVFAGARPLAAQLLESAMGVLRRGRGGALSAAVESSIADVLRLLRTPVHDADAHAAWQAEASRLVYEAKRILGDARSTTPPREHTSDHDEDDGDDHDDDEGDDDDVLTYTRLVDEVRFACLDMLLIFSGDVVLLRQRCRDAHLSVLDYVTAVCALAAPFATLAEVHDVVVSEAAVRYANDAHHDASDDNDDNDNNEHKNNKSNDKHKRSDTLRAAWLHAWLVRLTGAQQLRDVVAAMAEVADAAATLSSTQPCRDDADNASSNHDDDDDESDDESDSDDDDDEAAADAVSAQTSDGEGGRALHDVVTSTSLRRRCRDFALRCMAAHIADVCCPSAAFATAADMDAVLLRNRLVLQYAQLFCCCPRTWRAAGHYIVHSPLADPRALYRVVLYAAQLHGDGDSDAQQAQQQQRLHAFVRQMCSATSTTQVLLRTALRTRWPGSASVRAWLSASDDVCTRACADAVNVRATTQWRCGAVVCALQTAFAPCATTTTRTAQLYMQHALLRRVRAAAALRDVVVLQLGSAVRHGFVALDACTCARLREALLLCAHWSACAAAATAAAIAWPLPGAARATRCAASVLVPPSSSQRTCAAPTTSSTLLCVRAIVRALRFLDACAVTPHIATVLCLVRSGVACARRLRDAPTLRAADADNSDYKDDHTSSRSSAAAWTASATYVMHDVVPTLVHALQWTRLHRLDVREPRVGGSGGSSDNDRGTGGDATCAADALAAALARISEQC